MRLKLIAAFLLLTSPVLADSVTLFNTFGTAVPAPISLMLSMHPDENHNLLMIGVVNDPAGIRAVTISTTNSANGKVQVLANFTTPNFMFVWGRASMRSGSNPVTLQYTNAAGVVRQVTGSVNQPPAI